MSKLSGFPYLDVIGKLKICGFKIESRFALPPTHHFLPRHTISPPERITN